MDIYVGEYSYRGKGLSSAMSASGVRERITAVYIITNIYFTTTCILYIELELLESNLNLRSTMFCSCVQERSITKRNELLETMTKHIARFSRGIQYACDSIHHRCK